MGKFAQRRAQEAAQQPVAEQATHSVFAQRRAKVQADNVNAGNTDNLPDMPESLLTLEQCQVALSIHRDRLKQIKVVDEKAQYKRAAIADLEPFVQAYVAQGHNYPNDVAVWLAIWYFDCGLIEAFVSLAMHLQSQSQTLPSNFTSTIEVWICDQVYDYAAGKYKQQHSAGPYFGQVFDALREQQWNLYEPVGSKMWAMAAKLASLQGDHAKVVEFGEHALAMNDKAGVKKLVSEAKKQIAKHAVKTDVTDNSEGISEENSEGNTDSTKGANDNVTIPDGSTDLQEPVGLSELPELPE